MKKSILLFSILMLFVVSQARDFYKITRYEQKSDALFVCINHTKKPVYIEHFFSTEERKDTAAITSTIERLVAELYIKADEYKEPEKFIAKPDRAKRFENKTDSVRIANKKALILARRIAVKDSIAKASLITTTFQKTTLDTIKAESTPLFPE